MPCSHSSVCFEPSRYAKTVKYHGSSLAERHKAALIPALQRPNTKQQAKKSIPTAPFPAPLILPEDDLAEDPHYPGQTAEEWLHLPPRNKVTSRRRTIYIAAPPATESSARNVGIWVKPTPLDRKQPEQLRIQDIMDYLAAFYHPLPVKQLPASEFNFTTWDTSSNDSPLIGLRTSKKTFGIRHRPSLDGVYPAQLNLNDLLDVTLAVLPHDAYALLLIVNHDIYEDEEDDFACGRAYGGSRIAVVSTARYHPGLDAKQYVEREHSWPASHCTRYMQNCCNAEPVRPKKKAKTSRNAVPKEVDQSALRAAVTAHTDHDSTTLRSLSELWLARVCRTASHELGHCFGMDHCVYYACAMQGTASISEDARQPLYLCPVDLAKVCHATGSSSREHYQALLAFSQGKNRADGQLWRSFGAWLERMLELCV